MAREKKEKKVDRTCSTSIALTPSTRELLQRAGYASERYEDTIRRLSAHFEQCPFAQLQLSAVRILQELSDSEGAKWAAPLPEETSDTYAKRVISQIVTRNTLQIKGIEKLENENDAMYLLRLILMGVKVKEV